MIDTEFFTWYKTSIYCLISASKMPQSQKSNKPLGHTSPGEISELKSSVQGTQQAGPDITDQSHQYTRWLPMLMT